MAISPIGWVVYLDDQGIGYNIKMSQANAAAQGAAWSTLPTGGNVWWPFHKKNLRHVTGKDSASPAHRGELTVCDPNGTIWQQTQFNWAGQNYTYNIEGYFGEKKPATI